MKLFGMLDVLEESLAEATRDQLTGSELMNRLIQAETDYRKQRKTSNRIKTAKFRDRASFEDFDFTAQRSITRAQIKDIYSLDWLEEARPLMLIGPTGVGKTYVAQAAGSMRVQTANPSCSRASPSGLST